MSKFKKAIEKAAFDLVCLKHVKVITEADSVFPEWVFMKAEYDDNQLSSWQTKALITITNSMITQRRVFFTITRKSFREMSQNDQNWTTTIGLDNNAWRDLLNTAYTIGLFKTVKEVKIKGRDRILFELVDKDVLGLIMIDKAKQEKEALKFIQGEELAMDDQPDLEVEQVKEPVLVVTEDARLIETNALTEECLKLTLSDYERTFVTSIPEKLVKYKFLTEAQFNLLKSIAESRRFKAKLTEETAKDALKSFNGNVDELIHTFKKYDYSANKKGLATLINDCALPSEVKAKIGKALNIDPPKKENARYSY